MGAVVLATAASLGSVAYADHVGNVAATQAGTSGLAVTIQFDLAYNVGSSGGGGYDWNTGDSRTGYLTDGYSAGYMGDATGSGSLSDGSPFNWERTQPASGIARTRITYAYPAAGTYNVTWSDCCTAGGSSSSGTLAVVTGSQPQCSDGVDNDADGKTDFPADTGCSSSGDNTEAPNPQCSDGIDNDADGRTDYPADFGCTSASDNSEAPNPQCSDGIDNDADGKTDYPADAGCANAVDNSEGVACTTTSGVTTCLGLSPSSQIQRVRVVSRDVIDGTKHRVVGTLDVYRFTLPNGGTVNLACVVLLVDGTRVDPCAAANGVFVNRLTTFADVTEFEPVVVPGQELATVAICNAELVATVNGVGIASFPAYTVC